MVKWNEWIQEEEPVSGSRVQICAKHAQPGSSHPVTHPRMQLC